MCENCGKEVDWDLDIIGWYCESCENIRQCNICKKELCNYCKQICECERVISRTSSRSINDKNKKECDNECYEDLMKCEGCKEVYCQGHDYTNYCTGCERVYCIDCSDNYRGCVECDKYLCENCLINEPIYICHNDCIMTYCGECKYVNICDKCTRGQCEDCEEIAKRINRCKMCNKNVCEDCELMNICDDCGYSVCDNCIVICNERCLRIHCMMSSSVGVCENCSDIYCEICIKKCRICKRNLCETCHGIDICKRCKSHMIKYKGYELYKKLPNELVSQIVSEICI